MAKLHFSELESVSFDTTTNSITLNVKNAVTVDVPLENLTADQLEVLKEVINQNLEVNKESK